MCYRAFVRVLTLGRADSVVAVRDVYCERRLAVEARTGHATLQAGRQRLSFRPIDG